MNTWIYALTAVIAESLVSFAGVLLINPSKERLKLFTTGLLSLAAGAMLGDAFIHILPEAAEHSDSHVPIYGVILAGVIAFFVLEKMIRWLQQGHEDALHPVGYMSLFAGSLDNFVDGLVIGAAFLLSTGTGIATTIAIVCHEIPKEIGDFGILLHSGFGRRRAIIFNCATAVMSIIGTVTVLAAGSAIRDVPVIIGPLAAGIFIYIAVGGLMPQLQQTKGGLGPIKQIAILLAGVGIMVLVKLMD